ncbi:YugN-like family protein [Thalassobacillus hwangdonensis]|uniref:YugN-like family protein n=1 Tax=Thalassobacillus hwangdonensis TaxID=546108 RepID=A0ABW3L3Z9_9BACI
MIPISSKVTGEVFSLHDLESKLSPLGYVIGGNWDYDHGSFDYKIDDDVGYQFLRVPFDVEHGSLDAPTSTVKIGEPFLLSHKYQRGLDDNVHVGNIKASFDQFSEPQDPDASVDEKYIAVGQELVRELEATLLA